MRAKAQGETILATETGAGLYQVEVRVGDAAFLVDEPAEVGGLGSGPNPYNLLSAALGACKTMTVRLYANRKGWPLEKVSAAVRHSRADLNARDVFDVDLSLEGPLDDGQRARLLDIAERCPVSLTLTRGADVHTVIGSATQPPVQPSNGPGHRDCMEEACAD